MAKQKTEKQEHEQQFPSQILYSSPPEVESLNAWVREMEHKQGRNGATPPVDHNKD